MLVSFLCLYFFSSPKKISDAFSLIRSNLCTLYQFCSPLFPFLLIQLIQTLPQKKYYIISLKPVLSNIIPDALVDTVSQETRPSLIGTTGGATSLVLVVKPVKAKTG